MMTMMVVTTEEVDTIWILTEVEEEEVEAVAGFSSRAVVAEVAGQEAVAVVSAVVDLEASEEAVLVVVVPAAVGKINFL